MDEQQFDRLIDKARAEGALREKVEESKRRLDIINGDTAEIKRMGRETDIKVAALASSHSILLKVLLALTGAVFVNVALNVLNSF